MKPSDNLFNLINSLSKSEKRYLKINIFTGSENKNFFRLFNEIQRQSKEGNYNEKYIKNKFRDEKFIKQLTFTKNYLQKVIVKALIDFHSGNNSEAEIYNLIISAKIFFRKSLFDSYFASLEKAKLLAEKSEKFGALIEIIKLQMRLVRLKSRKKYKNRNLYNEEELAIKKIENISSYSKLLNAFYKLTKIPDFARSKILYKEAMNIFDSRLLHSEKNALSVTAKDMFYLLNIYKCELLDRKDELFFLSQRRYELFSNNKKIFGNDWDSKELSVNYSFLYYSIISGKIKVFESRISSFEKLSSVPERSIDKTEASTLTKMLKLYYHYKKNEYKKALLYAEEIYGYFRNNESLQNKDELLDFYFFYAKILFESGNYLKALTVTNVIITHEYKDVRYDILSYSYLLEMFLHYELKNYQLIASYIRTITRKLSVHREKDLSEKIILKFFAELISESKISEEFVLKKYNAKFSKLRKDKYERVFLNQLPVDKWVLKKIS